METIERYVYTDLNDVPQKWKTLKGARLSLSQINSIMEMAYSEPVETEAGYIPNYGKAKQDFEQSHEVDNNLWIKKRG